MLPHSNINGSSNNSMDETRSDGIILNSFMGIFFMFFYIVVYTASSVGNLLALYICYKNVSFSGSFQSTRSGFFSLYVATLSIADLLFTQLTVFDVVYAILGEWVMGPVVCKLQGFGVEMCYSASILTLMAISRERFKSVSDLQMKSRLQRIKERKCFALAAWLAAILLCSPLLYAYDLRTTLTGIVRCHNTAWLDLGRRIYYSLAAIILFLLPLVIMVVTHIKVNRVFKSQVAPNEQTSVAIRARQRKISRTLGVVSLVFLFLWSPFILTRTLLYFTWYEGEFVWKLSQLLTIASAAANPFIYCFYSAHFRLYLKRVVTCRFDLIAARENGESFTLNSLY